MVTPSKLNFSLGFAARSRREVQAMGSIRTIRVGTYIVARNGCQLHFPLENQETTVLASHMSWWPMTGTSLRASQQRAAAQHLPCCYRAQPWGWWGREALETQHQRSRCRSSLWRASSTCRVLLSCIFFFSSWTWVSPQLCCNWLSSSWRTALVSGSETVRNFSPTSMIKEYMACHLWRITALLFKRKKKLSF